MADKAPKQKKPKAPPTQKHLPIKEIRDNLVILKDGTLRRVLLISSINFALKSGEEQQAIIQGYVQFLNSVDFAVQIVIQSRELDISDYLERLQQQAKEQTNDLLKVQINEYRQYIGELVTLAEIMEKKFYVVVPYSPASDKKKNFWTRAYEVLSPTGMINLKEDKLNKYTEELDRRVGLVSGGLESLGLSTAVLDTRSLIELYYQSYNPGSSSEFLGDLNKMRIEEPSR